jgi:hypothetical protein
LGYDTIVIILTKPVLDEIDKHKRSPGRTRARASKSFHASARCCRPEPRRSS